MPPAHVTLLLHRAMAAAPHRRSLKAPVPRAASLAYAAIACAVAGDHATAAAVAYAAMAHAAAGIGGTDPFVAGHLLDPPTVAYDAGEP